MINLPDGHWIYKSEGFTCPKCNVYYPQAFHGREYNDFWEKNIYMFTDKCCASYFLIDGTDVTLQVENKIKNS